MAAQRQGDSSFIVLDAHTFNLSKPASALIDLICRHEPGGDVYVGVVPARILSEGPDSVGIVVAEKDFRRVVMSHSDRIGQGRCRFNMEISVTKTDGARTNPVAVDVTDLVRR